MVVVPGRLGIGAFAPRLDPRGNSVRGLQACEALAERYSLHSFARGEGPDPLVEALEGKAAF